MIKLSVRDKLNNDQIDKLCRAVSARVQTSHGNCVVFVVAMAKFLGIPPKAAVVEVFGLDDDFYELLHALLEHNGDYFDGHGYQDPESILEFWSVDFKENTDKQVDCAIYEDVTNMIKYTSNTVSVKQMLEIIKETYKELK